MILFAASKTMAETSHINLENRYFNRRKTCELVKCLQSYDCSTLSMNMKLSPKIGEITFDYYQNFGSNNAKALDIYSGLSFRQVIARNDKYQEKNVYIISALYGIVNAGDLLSRYRLDFTMNKIVACNLYQLWREEITSFLNQHSSDEILNLCSQEYFKVVDLKVLTKPVFNLVCMEKMHSTDLKKLRGQILNYCIANEIKNYSKLIDFKTQEYQVVDINGFNIVVSKTL